MQTWSKVALGVAAWEVYWWHRRNVRRVQSFAEARALADALGKPLVLVGAPDGGMTSGAGCGDVTIDLAGSSCPNSLRADVTRPLPFADDSAVVLVQYVLEYVGDYGAALRELRRIAGPNLFVERVQPWTLTSLLYPGAQRTVPEQRPRLTASALRRA